MTLILTDSELIALTGYKRAADQMNELRRQGFYRARVGRLGSVILERAHYDSVCSGATRPGQRPQLRPA